MTSRILSLLAVVAATLLLPAAVAGSCMEPPPLDQHLEQADAVFVGTVIGLADERRTATIAVTEVWRGPDLPPEVLVHGGPDEPGMATSVDRSYEPETEYLVAASLVDGRLTDNSCSATQPWDESLAAQRPSDARPPSGPSDGGSGEGGPLPIVPLAVGALFLLIVGGSVLAFRGRD